MNGGWLPKKHLLFNIVTKVTRVTAVDIAPSKWLNLLPLRKPTLKMAKPPEGGLVSGLSDWPR